MAQAKATLIIGAISFCGAGEQDWLGATPLTARGVSRALKVNQLAQLANAADCLNKNVAKGFCKKEGVGFVITPAGWDRVPAL